MTEKDVKKIFQTKVIVSISIIALLIIAGSYAYWRNIKVNASILVWDSRDDILTYTISFDNKIVQNQTNYQCISKPNVCPGFSGQIHKGTHNISIVCNNITGLVNISIWDDIWIVAYLNLTNITFQIHHEPFGFD